MLDEEECLRHAKKCEIDSRATTDDFNRTALLAMAAQWHLLADSAERHRIMIGAARLSNAHR